MMDTWIFESSQNPSSATYDTLLRVAKTAEELGYDAFFRSDHYLHMGDVDGLPGPTDAGSPWPASPGRPAASGSAR